MVPWFHACGCPTFLAQISLHAGDSIFCAGRQNILCCCMSLRLHTSAPISEMYENASGCKLCKNKNCQDELQKSSFWPFYVAFWPICTASSDNPNLRIEVQQRKGSALSQLSCGKFGIQLCKFHLNGIGIHDSITIYTQDLQIRWHNACVHHSLNMPKLPCEELCHLLWAWYNIVSYKKNSKFAFSLDIWATQKPSCLLLYWLFNRDPYNGLL